MEAIVEEPLGDVERAHAGAFDRALANEFVHVDAVIWHGVGVAQLDPQIIGVEDGVLGIGPQPGGAVAPDIGIGAHEHAELSEKRGNATDRVLGLDEPVAVALSPDRAAGN